MSVAELMARAENALRTGQTENLFPVLACRALELIEEEKQANRAEWVKLVPSKRIDFAMEGMVAALSGMGEAIVHFGEVAGKTMERQSDYALVSGGPR